MERLETEIDLSRELERSSPGYYEDILAHLEEEMNFLLKSKLTGARICSKVNHLDNDEKPTRFFLSEEISKTKDKGMKTLTVDDVTLYENEEIIDACHDFYVQLFSEEPVEEDVIDEFLTDLPFEPMETIGEGGTITIAGTKFLVRKVAEKSSRGGVRWISPFKLVRVHWLPGYVPDVYVHNFLQQFYPVVNILPERATEGYENGVCRAKVGSEGVDRIPHLSKIDYEGMEFPVLITVPGRPPLCLRCHSIGHVRYECDAKSQAGSWAARVGGARAGAFAGVDLEEEGEEEGETEVERKERLEKEGKKRGKRKTVRGRLGKIVCLWD